MARGQDIDPTMAMALLGLQDSSGLAGSVALVLAMQRRWGLTSPEEAAATAARFGLSVELAPLVPPSPHFLSSRKRREGFQRAIIGLKSIDALPAEERASAIKQLRQLLSVAGT